MGGRLLQIACGMLLLTVLAACAEREVILPGERQPVRASVGDAGVLRAPASPVNVGRAVVTRSWTHPVGTPDNNPPHAAIGAEPQLLWSTSIGQGDKQRFRITAQPVSDGARIYAMDSRSTVSAVATTGDVVWSVNVTPPGESPESATGGGLAVAGGRLYVTTGFGTLVALDAATGAQAWSHDFNSVASGAPTVAGGLIYAITRNGVGWALDPRTGRVRWTVGGLTTAAGIVGGPSPAVGSDGLAVFAFPDGGIAGVDAATGTVRWRSVIGGRRLETVASQISDVTGDPVLAGALVVAGTHDGRTAAFDRSTGAEIWTADEGAMSSPVVTSTDVFSVTDRNALVRLNRNTGGLVWSQPLSLFRTDNPRRFSALWAHFGPILAGGRLVVASDDGNIRFVDPGTGTVTGVIRLPSGAASGPIVVGRTLYLVTENGQLHAFR